MTESNNNQEQEPEINYIITELLNNGEYETIINITTEAINLTPKNFHAYLFRSLAYAEQKKYDEAIEDINEAILLNPENPHLYFHRSNIYYDYKIYFDAEYNIKKVLELDPDNPFAINFLGMILLKKGELFINDAIESFNKAIELDPDNEDYKDNLKMAYQCKEHYDKENKKLQDLIDSI